MSTNEVSRNGNNSTNLLAALGDAAAYPDNPAKVEPIETHISWVFLTDDYVYKLKKPIKLDFLDYSSIEARREMCEEEVRLNRRLAPDVYLGVERITTTKDGDIRVGGSGEILDWAVKMRRLPAERSLDELIRHHAVTSDHVDRLLRALIDFYQSSAAVPLVRDEYPQRLIGLVKENRSELVDATSGEQRLLVKRLHASQLQVLELSREIFSQRVDEGCIVDGHGDLRPDHVYLTPNPVIIDCIEFSSEIRQVDVLDELCFFEMECDILNATSLGKRVRQEIGKSLADNYSPRLASFYKTYRACVRAKVAMIRAQQSAADVKQARSDAARHLQLAAEYEKGLADPKLIVVRGLMGTGKSTVASELAARLGAEHLMTDRIRRDLFGAHDQGADYGKGRYSAANRLQVYKEMFRRADELLQSGLSVILDGTFLSGALRMSAHSLARRHAAASVVLRCECPEKTAMHRIDTRRHKGNVLSEARSHLFDQQRRDEDAPLEGEQEMGVSTAGSVNDSVVAALQQVKESAKFRSPRPS